MDNYWDNLPKDIRDMIMPMTKFVPALVCKETCIRNGNKNLWVYPACARLKMNEGGECDFCGFSSYDNRHFIGSLDVYCIWCFEDHYPRRR